MKKLWFLVVMLFLSVCHTVKPSQGEPQEPWTPEIIGRYDSQGVYHSWPSQQGWNACKKDCKICCATSCACLVIFSMFGCGQHIQKTFHSHTAQKYQPSNPGLK